MKKLLCIVLIIALLPIMPSYANEFGNMQNFSFDELGGMISGVCYGKDSKCIYGDSAFLIINGEESENFTIDHPKIKDDMPHIRGVFEKDGKYSAIVYDSSIRKSYYISDIGGSDERYGRLREHAYEKSVLTPDGLLVIGQKKGLLWIGLLSDTGQVRWEQLGFSSGFFFQNCCYYNSHIYTVSRHHRLPLMLINVFTLDGKRIYGEQYDLKELLSTDKKTLLDAPVMAADKSGIFVAGRVIPMKTPPYALTINLDLEGKNISIKKYESVINILSAYKLKNNYFMLAEDRTRKQYFIYDDDIQPINKNSLRIDGILRHEDKNFAFGIKLGIESFVANFE